VSFGEGPAEDGEVLGEDENQPAVDPAGTGDDPIAGKDLLVEPEVGGAMSDEAVQLEEATLVKQKIDPLASGELAFLVLLRHPLGAAALFSESLPMVKLIEEFLGV
jgi:hypothetical protein